MIDGLAGGARISQAACIVASCWLWLGACEPQDIYLFDPDAVTLPGPDAGNGGSGGSTSLPAQPPCESAACEECVRERRCETASATLWCHPLSAECSIGCNPEASGTDEAVCPADQRCRADIGLCVDCLDSSHCASAAPACDIPVGQCVECIGPGSCPTDRSVCLVEERRCVECTADSDCGAGVCHPAMLRCVGCRTDSDCGGEDPRCEPSALVCVECLSDDDCTTEPDKPFCSSELECDDD